MQMTTTEEEKMQTIYKKSEDANVEIEVITLEDYENEGGVYSDEGNNGEDVINYVADFVGGISTENYDEDGTLHNIHDLDSEAASLFDHALGHGAYGEWCDTATGYTLLTDWPAFVPLEARKTTPRTAEDVRELRDLVSYNA